MSDAKEHRHTEGILVNRLNFKVNEVEFNKRYTILHAEYAAYEVRKNAVRLLSKFHTVKAIRYEFGGTSFYVLLKGNSEKDEIKDTLNTIVLDDPVQEEKYSQVAPDMIFELLLIGLSYNDSDKEEDGENLAYSNLDGGVYTFEPEDVKEDRVVTFNIKARKAKDCVDLFGETQMQFPAQTFASVAKMNETEADRKYLKGLPRFQMVGNTYMKLSNGGEFGSGGREYVKHGYRGMKKASMDFLALSGVQDFDKSKMGRTRLTLRKMPRVRRHRIRGRVRPHRSVRRKQIQQEEQRLRQVPEETVGREVHPYHRQSQKSHVGIDRPRNHAGYEKGVRRRCRLLR